MAAVGASATYFDFGAFEEVQLTISSADVTVATAGVTVNQVTKRGTNEWRGEARYLRTDGSLQSEPAARVRQQDRRRRGVRRQRRRPADQGPPVGLGLLGRERHPQPGAQPDGRRPAARPHRAQGLQRQAQRPARRSQLRRRCHFWTNDKLKFGRVFTFLGFPVEEATHDQTTPSDIWKVEDTHLFGSSFPLTGLWSKDDGDFTLPPKGGLDADMFTDTDNILHGTSFDFTQHAVIEQARLDGNYFVTDRRRQPRAQVRRRLPRAGEPLDHGVAAGHNSCLSTTACSTTSCASAAAARSRSKTEYNSAWLQDTVTLGRWTFAAGFRYDEQTRREPAQRQPRERRGGGAHPRAALPRQRRRRHRVGDDRAAALAPPSPSAPSARRWLRATFSQYAAAAGPEPHQLRQPGRRLLVRLLLLRGRQRQPALRRQTRRRASTSPTSTTSTRTTRARWSAPTSTTPTSTRR